MAQPEIPPFDTAVSRDLAFFSATKTTESYSVVTQRRSSFAPSKTPVHDFLAGARQLIILAVGNLILAGATFASFFTSLSSQGISLLKFVFAALVVTGALAIRDLCGSKTRLSAGAALLLCVPILMFFGLLEVWEGPLYVSVTGGAPINFKVKSRYRHVGVR